MIIFCDSLYRLRELHSGNSILMQSERLRICDAAAQRELADENYRRALEILVEGYQHMIVGFCAKVLDNVEQAEDMAQDIFLAAYQAMPRFRSDASLRTWLFAIARKQCLKASRNRYRRRRIEQHQREAIANTVHRARSPAPGESRELRFQQVQQSLTRLTTAERALLMMRYDTGLPIAEVAHILGISVSSVRRRLARALQRLREVMIDDA
ncbi:hypothetical protein NKDENANG_02816 [Candidatus Entotheonellaceae bacterium PAL068K]